MSEERDLMSIFLSEPTAHKDGNRKIDAEILPRYNARAKSWKGIDGLGFDRVLHTYSPICMNMEDDIDSQMRRVKMMRHKRQAEEEDRWLLKRASNASMGGG